MSAVEIRGLDEMQQYLQQIPDESFSAFRKVYSKSILKVQNTVANRASRGPLIARTGELSRSVRSSVTGNSVSTLKAKVFTDSKYAPIHEKGGVIRAKNAYRGLEGGPYLNIPADSNKTPAGVMRFSPREVFAMGGYIAPSKGPRARYVMMAGPRRKMYVLVK